MSIPQGTLKILNIADIVMGERFRANLGDIEALTESIKDKGILQPIAVSTDMQLLDGGRRLTAAIAAELTKIPALVIKSADELNAREVELMCNCFRKDFDWPEQCALISEIDRLYKEKEVDWSSRKTAQLLNKSVGGVSQSIQLANAIQVIPELADHKSASDAFKVLKNLEEETIIHELAKRQHAQVHGDMPGLTRGLQTMLKLADANYCIGDVFEELAALRSGGRVDIIECDPPYGINLKGVKASKDSVTATVHAYTEIDAADYNAFLVKLAKELYRVADRNCWLLFWFGPTWWAEVRSALKDAGWLVDDIPAIWAKEHGQTLQPELYLARGYEPFFICRKGNPVMTKRGRLNVFQFPGVTSSDKIHTTERPVPLIEEMLSIFGIASNIVLVPFLGSGNTLRAAYNLGMKCFGFDISNEYKAKFMLAVEEDTRKLNDAAEE